LGVANHLLIVTRYWIKYCGILILLHFVTFPLCSLH